MGRLGDRESLGAVDSPVADRATPGLARTLTPAPDVATPEAAVARFGSAGNVALARHLRSGTPPGLLSGWSHTVGNAAIRRALAGPGPGGVPDGFTDRLGGAESGAAIPADARTSLESSFGTPLDDVRVHVGARSGALADDIDANAFTVGRDIYFGNGRFDPGSPRGYHLLAHEVTHTLQQGGPAPAASGATMTEPTDTCEVEADAVAGQVTAARFVAGSTPPPDPVDRGGSGAPARSAAGPIMRDARDLIPDFIIEGVRDVVLAVPGYRLVTVIIGKDPITDKSVAATEQELVEELLTFGPFGAEVGQVLHAVDVIGDIVSMITGGLAQHNLTLARVEHDFGAAWDEMSVTKGIDGNAAIVHRYVSAIAADITAFINAIVDRVVQIVRSVIAKFAAPLLETPQIKPVWDLARKVLHYDPLLGQPVEAPTVEILGDFLRLIGKQDVLAQMQERGTLQQTADWLDAQFATFASIRTDVGKLFGDAWDAISPANLPNLLNTLPALADRAFGLIGRVADFATTIIGKVLELIKHSLLGWLSQHAHQIPGFHLLTVIIERNPFTGESVPRTAENLIKGFITLLPDGEVTYEHLAQSGVIADAAAQIDGAMGRLGISWDLVVSTFRGIWDSLQLADLLAPIAAFERVLAMFHDPIGRIVEFVTEVVKVIVTLILKLMNFPSDLLGSIINNAMAAIEDIKRDPVAFLVNMLEALKTGVTGFLDGILQFLLQGLASWLFRGLGQIGITIPRDLSFGSILTLVLDVLGISIEHLWQKLGEHIGQDKVARIRGALDRMGQAWAFIKDVQDGGIGAIWTHLTDQLGNLWDTLLGMARDWIMSEIVQKVTAKLISMLDPTGVMAVVNSFIAFFKAIQSAIEYIRDILRIVNEYVTTFAQVAAGNIAPGAEKIKQGLADAVPIAIGFLANQVGLGNVPEKIVEIIGGLRELVDKAIDWLIDKAIQLGAAALDALGLGGGGQAAGTDPTKPGELNIDKPFTSDGEQHEVKTGPGARELFVFSPPPGTPVSEIKDPKTGQPDTELVKLNTDYLDAHKRYDDAIAAQGGDPGAKTGWTTIKKEIDEIIGKIVARVTVLGVGDAPGASAPGIGELRRYKQQAQRIGFKKQKQTVRNGPPVWWLEAEHIIPFDLGRELWDLVSVAVPERGGWEDLEQTTIMIYERAADEKTDNDERAISAAFAQHIASSGAKVRLQVLEDQRETAGLGGGSGSEVQRDQLAQQMRNILDAVVNPGLDQAGAVSVGRTKTVVQNEWTANGAKRAEGAKVPDDNALDAAVEAQKGDLRRLVTRAVEELES